MELHQPTIKGATVSNSYFQGTAYANIGGLSSQFLKADGSIDASVYALNSALASYALTTHNHTGVYQPILSGTGFIKASGTTITYDNSTYSISTHNHTGVYEPFLTAGTTLQYLRGDKTWATFPTSLPASDVYAWAKADTKPAYTYTEVGAAASAHNHTGVYEASLGNPVTNGYVLSSTSAGVRSWIAMSAGGSYVDLTTNQTIGGIKTFTGNVFSANSITNETDTYTATAKIEKIITLSLAEYNDIGTKSSNTMYVII
jgi:hypothetical protein